LTFGSGAPSSLAHLDGRGAADMEPELFDVVVIGSGFAGKW
jgi:hypothetical protein